MGREREDSDPFHWTFRTQNLKSRRMKLPEVQPAQWLPPPLRGWLRKAVTRAGPPPLVLRIAAECSV